MTLRREPLIARDPLAPDEAKAPALVDRVGRAGFAVGAALIISIPIGLTLAHLRAAG